MTNAGEPVAGATVELHKKELIQEQRARLTSEKPEREALASTQSDAKGAFTFASPERGVYEVSILAPGWAPLHRTIEHDEDLGALAMLKAPMQRGSLSSGGKPLVNAVVSIHYGTAEYLVRTDDQGSFAAPDPKRAYRMIVVHPEVGVSDTMRERRMSPLTSLTHSVPAGVEVRGTIVAEDGKTPVAGARVRVDQWELARSGEDGAFVIERAPAGWASITAEQGELQGRRSSTAKGPHVIRLEKASTVSGRVTDAGANAGVAHVTVSLADRGSGEVWQTTVDAKGNFTLAAPAGSYQLSADHPAFVRSTSEVTLKPSQRSSHDVPLKRLARVSGTVVDERREPVGGATIAPESASSELSRMQRFRFAQSRTMSGPDGRFAIRVSPDEQLQLRGVRPGYPDATSDPFALGAGERKTGVVLTMPTGVAVTGRVTDADGNPLEDIAVSARESEGGRMSLSSAMVMGMPSEELDVVRTNAEGAYTYRVKEGTHDFNFRGEGWASKTISGQEVSRSAPTVVDATLTRAVDISGRVVRKGSGVEGVELSAFNPGSQPVRATSAADGSFTLTGLTPGPVRVALSKQFMREQRTATAPTSNLVIELPPGAQVSGRVIDKASGKAIREFKAGVSLSRSGGGRVIVMPPQLESFTSDDGSFTLENVPAGSMTIVGEAPGYATGRSNVTIEDGKNVEDLEIALEPAVRLAGRVTGPNGAALADAFVSMVPATSGGPMFAGRNGATTNARGEYSLDGLTAGEATILFQHEQFASARKTVNLQGRETQLDAQLAAGVAVRGTVVNDAGAPVADAQVEVMGSTAFDRVRSGSAGEFEFKALEAGRYRLTAEKAGYMSTLLENVDVGDGQPIRIELKSGATLTGRVLGLTAEEFATTSVTASSGRARATTSVDSAGNYKLVGAPTGTVTVSAMTGNVAGTRSAPLKTIELTPGGSQQLDIEFAGDVVIEGRVLQNGQPLPRVGVSFAPRVMNAGTFASAQADDQGRYRITGVSEGDYTISVFDPQRYVAHTSSYHVRGSARFDIAFTSSTVRGRVIDAASGGPLADVAVGLQSTSAIQSRGLTRSALTDAQGSFVFDAVTEGAYTMTASKSGYGAQPRDLTVASSPIDGLEIVLSRSSGVTLRVVDARNGRPVTASAMVFDAAGRVVLDSRGGFGGGETELNLALAPGSYTATVSSMGFAPQTIRIQSPGTQSVRVTPGGALHVRSKHASPMRVLILDASGTWYPRMGPTPPYRSIMPGVPMEASALAPGRYTVQVVAANESVVASTQVTVNEGQVTTIDL